VAGPDGIPLAEGVRGLIFDCDGTLADSMPIHIDAWHQAFAAGGVEVPTAWLDDQKGQKETHIVNLANEQFGFTLDPRATVDLKHRVFRSRLDEVRPIGPVVNIVRANQGRLPMAVASGGVRANVDAILRLLDLTDAFSAILTADDDVPPKPSPEIFLEAARRLGVEPSACQVFEDGDMGLVAARRAGMTATDIRPYLAKEREP